MLLASWLTRLLTTFQLPIPIALSIDLRLDARVLAFTAGVSLLTGVLAGLAPALRATRANLVWDLKSDTAGGRIRGRRWTMRDVLVVGQMAVTIVLLVTAGLLVRSLSAAQKANVGFATDGLAIVSADTGMLRYTPERSQQVLERGHAPHRGDSRRAGRRHRVPAALLAQLQSHQHRRAGPSEGG